MTGFNSCLLFPLFFCLSACGLPSVSVISLPVAIAASNNQSVQILLPASYMNSIPNFQGVAFFYKIYPDDFRFYNGWSPYGNFQAAYRGDLKRIVLSYTAESTLTSYGYLPFNRDLSSQSPQPLLHISSVDQGRDLVVNLSFKDLFSVPTDLSQTAKVVVTENNLPVAGYEFDLLRRAIEPHRSQYKTLSYLTHDALDSQRADPDLVYLPTDFLSTGDEGFNIVLYGVVYAGDVFNPERSQAFRLTYIGPLRSGS